MFTPQRTIGGSIFLLTVLTAGLALAQGDGQRQTASTSKRAPTVLSASLITNPLSSVVPLQSTGWYVVVGSFPKRQRRQANARAANVSAQGFNMAVYNSSEFEGLTPGLWVVMDGPYTQREAQEILNNARSVVPDAYIKRAVHYD